MPPAVIIGIVVFILIILTVGLFVYFKSGDTPVTTPTQNTPSTNTNTNTNTNNTNTNNTTSTDTGISNPPPEISSVTPGTSSTPEPPQASVTPPAPDCSDPVAYYYYYSPDVQAAGIDAQQHWLSNGYVEGRKSCWPAPPPLKNLLDSSGKTAPSTMMNGQELHSLNGKFKLTMQGDGNLVGYRMSDAKAFWNKGYQKKPVPPYKLAMQGDGNLVIYDSAGKPAWQSGKAGKIPPYQFVLQDDRNMVVYDGNGKAIWDSGSKGS